MSKDDAKREQVAKAICAAYDDRPDYFSAARGYEYRWQDYLGIADAAILAYNG